MFKSNDWSIRIQDVKNMTRRKSENVKLTMPASESRDHIQGPTTAPVTLLEYGDYECPYCTQAYIIIKEVQERLRSKLRFVFRNFHVTNVRPHAAWVRRYYAKKGLQFNALIKAFELLNDNAHRNARIRLYRVSQVSCRMSLFHLPNLLSRYSDTAAFWSCVCS